MFTESAELYDLIYSSFKDYEAESAAIAKLIRDLEIPAADKEKIFWGNAQRLLKLN